MELHDEQALEPLGHLVDPVPARPAGLLAKLVSAVRPEFRVDVFIVDPSDPVFGGAPCHVTGCGRAAVFMICATATTNGGTKTAGRTWRSSRHGPPR